MKIRILSDLHLEFGRLDLPVMEDESNQVLVLAGDIGLAAKSWSYIPFIEEVSERFQDVIYVMGNHEYYDTSLNRGLDKIKDRILFETGATNVHVLNNEVLRIGDVSFVCSTLWTSCNNMDAMTMYQLELQMSDYRAIRVGPPSEPYQRKLRATDTTAAHLRAKEFLFPAIKAEKEAGQKVVVVTHHAPSVLSIHQKYRESKYYNLNGGYASKLEEDIFEAKPDLMIHGHVHNSFDYILEDELTPDGARTRIVCNPRGYADKKKPDLNPAFNPVMVIEI